MSIALFTAAAIVISAIVLSGSFIVGARFIAKAIVEASLEAKREEDYQNTAEAAVNNLESRMAQLQSARFAVQQKRIAGRRA